MVLVSFGSFFGCFSVVWVGLSVVNGWFWGVVIWCLLSAGAWFVSAMGMKGRPCGWAFGRQDRVKERLSFDGRVRKQEPADVKEHLILLWSLVRSGVLVL